MFGFSSRFGGRSCCPLRHAWGSARTMSFTTSTPTTWPPPARSSWKPRVPGVFFRWTFGQRGGLVPVQNLEKQMTTTLTLPVAVTKDLLTGAEWSPADARDLLQRTAEIKARPSRYASTLRGKHIALIFEKPSLRTRVTFEVGIQSMGGFVVFLDHTQARLGERESIPDVARNLQCWVQGIVARVYEQRVLEEMASNISIPVINALSDKFHPCQALADFFTLEEKFGSLKGLKLAYVGDGNNVCNSLIYLAARLGVNLRIATPA